MWLAIFIAAIFISSLKSGGATSYSCDEGFRLEDSKCRQLDAGEFFCPAETKNEDGCVITTYYCSSIDLTGPIKEAFLAILGCPNGFTKDDVEGVCKKMVLRGIPVTTCNNPRHYGRNGRCRASFPPLQVCPDNAPAADCVSRRYNMNESVHYYCLNGYDRDGDWCNFKQGSSEKVCNYGYYLSTNADKCISNIESAGKRHCRKGRLLGNSCIDIITRPFQYMCPPGSGVLRASCLQGVRSGANCQNTRNVSPALICPKRFRPVSVGVGCESINTVNANITPAVNPS